MKVLLKRHVRFASLAALLLLVPAPPYDVLPAFARYMRGASAPPLAAGVHAPNRPWREQDFDRVARGGLGAVKLMSYHPPESYARLRGDVPRIQFAVRLDTPWNALPHPEQFVAANVPRLHALIDAGYDLWVEIGNEPNLELHPQAEVAFARWYEEVLARLRAAVPEAKYGFPGLAHDRRESAWLKANAAGIEASDWIGVHAYWLNEREMVDPRRALRLIDVHRRFPRLPLLVTEAGNYNAAVSSAERRRQYARFVRVLDRLPYVRAVHYFILSGTKEWQSFFLDNATVAAVGGALRDPAPLLDGLAEARRTTLAAVVPLLAARPALPKVEAAPVAVTPVPTPPPSLRRRLLVDPNPVQDSGDTPTTSASWFPAAGAVPPAARLRTASEYLATHLSVRLEMAPPVPGTPLAVQLAESDLFAPVGGDASVGTGRPGRAASVGTGFALLWDGARWRLQYLRSGEVLADVRLAGVPSPSDEQAWYHVEVALEPRSAAAWIWRRGDPQPEQPNAVFAPPEVAAADGARPRALFLPAHPLVNVVLEGMTRD
ncbi:MAG: hypothetical protein HY332_04135 [Chloroflexi bacterium]|nr:hypothetical protein [Chloroflexota bacterium]